MKEANISFIRNFEILKKKNLDNKRQFEINFQLDSTIETKDIIAELYDVQLDENDNEKSRIKADETVSINGHSISILIEKIKKNSIPDIYEFTKALTLIENGAIIFDAYIFSYNKNTKPSTQGDIIKINKP